MIYEELGLQAIENAAIENAANKKLIDKDPPEELSEGTKKDLQILNAWNNYFRAEDKQ